MRGIRPHIAALLQSGNGMRLTVGLGLQVECWAQAAIHVERPDVCSWTMRQAQSMRSKGMVGVSKS
ncbi:MAG: hypothetical protein ABSD70_12925 [Terracidiphilus sp.]|jgi:hypothetical protein